MNITINKKGLQKQSWRFEDVPKGYGVHYEYDAYLDSEEKRTAVAIPYHGESTWSILFSNGSIETRTKNTIPFFNGTLVKIDNITVDCTVSGT